MLIKSFFSKRLHALSLRWARRQAEPLMAQALYDDLSEEEAAQLQALLERHPVLAEELSDLKDFMPSLTLRSDDWQGDLLPTLKAQIQAGEAVAQGALPQRSIKFVLAGAALILGGGLYAFFMLAGSEAPSGPQTQAFLTPRDSSVLRQEMEVTRDLVARGHYADASSYLQKAIDGHPHDPVHADALLQLADIHYTHLQQYDKAYASYKVLEQEHRAVFNRSWDNNKHVRLLSAAFPLDFKPVAQLEAAARSESPLHSYELILSEYPEDIWGDEALRAMMQLVSEEDFSRDDPTALLQHLASLCTESVAVDRICLEMGHTCYDQLNDREQARDYFNRAAESHHLALADCAREALARLD
ncbi:MAG: hypothetical protein GX130_01625 [Candidatus Hydrogenedens sp.]|nr:hypothetical protein [Candidatus Hydrogenedens sp.]